MNTIPNIAPDMNAKLLTLDEVKSLVNDDDFVWVELNHNYFDGCEDETFHLRVGMKHSMFIDLCLPMEALHLPYEDYNKVWRIWNMCPVWDNDEIWEED